MRNFFIELDKAGAEWVLVAYLSGDQNMLSVIERGVSPHIVTGSLLTGLPEAVIERESKLVGMRNDPTEIEALRLQMLDELEGAHFLPRSMSIRQCAKKANHGLNYMEDWYMFSFINEIAASESKKVVSGYRYQVYPNIPTWWDSITTELKNNHRTLTDLMGHRRQFLGNWGKDLWKSAIAYKPQSTNGKMVRQGGRLIYNAMDQAEKGNPEFAIFKHLDLNANIHDSLLLSFKWGQWFTAAEVVLQCVEWMTPELEARGRKFKIKTDMKVGGKNWSLMKECKIYPKVSDLGRAIAEAVKASEASDAQKKA